jgi:selenide,water dikinase
MTHLNDGAAAAASEVGAKAVTDITGFGLLGHLRSMLAASGCAAEIAVRSIPLLPGARALAESGFVPGGTRRNVEAVLSTTSFDAGLGEVDRILLADAQTSGGLLIAVPEAGAEALRTALRARGTPQAALIGSVVAGEPGRITVHT